MWPLNYFVEYITNTKGFRKYEYICIMKKLSSALNVDLFMTSTSKLKISKSKIKTHISKHQEYFTRFYKHHKKERKKHIQNIYENII